MGGLVEAAIALRAELASLDPALLSGPDAAALAEELARTAKACAGAAARAALRAGDCGMHRLRGYSRAEEWLARSEGTTVGEARSVLETAGALERCPAATAALAAGELSLAQAGEITRTEAACPGSEAGLVELARRADVASLRQEARKRRLAAVDPEELAARHHRSRSARTWRDGEGMVRLTAALPPVVGVALANRLDAEAQRLRREAATRGEAESFEAAAADALVGMLRGAGEPARGRTEVVVVIDLAAWRRGHAHGGEVCHLVGGGPVPVAVARQLAEDAFVKAVVHDGVAISHVRHLGRHIPAALRTALDLGPVPQLEGAVCVVDGCGRRYGLEYDHLDPVANGGATTYDNLRPRCKPHHWDKTERDRQAGLLGASTMARAGPGTGPP